MKQSISHTLLITCVLIASSCKTHFYSYNSNARNISIESSSNSIDSQVVNIYLPFKKELEKDMQRVISISKIEMIKNKPESYLTNFLADLLLEEGIKGARAFNMDGEPSISYYNYGGIRTFIPKGEINVGNVFELMPFENELVYLKLNGTQVQEFFNCIAAKGGDSVGGVQFIISNDKAKNIQIKGEKLAASNTYWLVTNDYVANGGDGLDILTKRDTIINSGKKIRDIIISHMEEKHKKGEVLAGKLDGRISNE